jgi:hypothetical protein
MQKNKKTLSPVIVIFLDTPPIRVPLQLHVLPTVLLGDGVLGPEPGTVRDLCYKLC